MASQYSQIQIRRGNLADFQSSQLVLASGEPCYVIDANRFVIGDGSEEVANLPVLNGTGFSGSVLSIDNTATNGQVAISMNDGGIDRDTQIKGLTDDYTFYVDASNNRIGVGTNTPSYKLEVNGTFSATSVNVNGGNGYTFPTSDGTANQVLATDGNGALTFANPQSAQVQSTIEGDNSNGNDNSINTIHSDGLMIETNGVNRWVVTDTGHLLPAVHNSYDIGSASKKVRDLYVDSNSIHIGDTKIGVENDELIFTNQNQAKEHICCTDETVPTSSSSTGKKGHIAADDDYFYLCWKDNNWKRISLDRFDDF